VTEARDKRRRDPGLSLFKLDASVNATVEIGSKGVRESNIADQAVHDEN
jgi:hypothetical protein